MCWLQDCLEAGLGYFEQANIAYGVARVLACPSLKDS